MKQRLMQAKDVAYLRAPFTGENTSNFEPYSDLVVIMVDPPDIKLGSKGLLTMPEEKVAQMVAAASSGVVAAIGDGAFMWTADRNRPWHGRKPEVGDRILFERYSGKESYGDDGHLYRLMSDNSITAKIKED
jgi:co-chaperonin GroES (HSP10)